MNKLVLAVFLTICASSVFAMDIEDKELLSDRIVRYFKEVSDTTGQPISLKITLRDTYSGRDDMEDEQTLPLGFSPRPISTRFILDISDAFKQLLPALSEGKESERLSLDVTIWVDAPGHKEKVNGFCSLKKEE